METFKELENCTMAILNEATGSSEVKKLDLMPNNDKPAEQEAAPAAVEQSFNSGDQIQVINKDSPFYNRTFMVVGYDNDGTVMCVDEDGSMMDNETGEDFIFKPSDVDKIESGFSDADNADDKKSDTTSDYFNDDENELDPETGTGEEFQDPNPQNQIDPDADKSLEDQERSFGYGNNSLASDDITVDLQSLTMSVLNGTNINESCLSDCKDGKSCIKKAMEAPKPQESREDYEKRKNKRNFVKIKKGNEEPKNEVHESFEEMKQRKLTEAKEKGFSV